MPPDDEINVGWMEAREAELGGSGSPDPRTGFLGGCEVSLAVTSIPGQEAPLPVAEVATQSGHCAPRPGCQAAAVNRSFCPGERGALWGR